MPTRKKFILATMWTCAAMFIAIILKCVRTANWQVLVESFLAFTVICAAGAYLLHHDKRD